MCNVIYKKIELYHLNGLIIEYVTISIKLFLRTGKKPGRFMKEDT